jgi:hypothetical protein
MKMNSQERTGIMTTTLMNIVLFVERMKEAMTQQRQMKPAEEW